VSNADGLNPFRGADQAEIDASAVPAQGSSLEGAVRKAVAGLHTYHHHRGHTPLDGRPPAGRVPNLAGQ
jgi:hypothetical protein